MSGGQAEPSATFYVVAETSKQSLDKSVKALGKQMDNLLPSTDLSKMGIKGSKTDLEKAGKFAEVEILKKADATQYKAFKQDLRKIFNAESKICTSIYIRSNDRSY